MRVDASVLYGDHVNTVNRPSCDATSATASRWSWTNCAAERCRVPPSCVGVHLRRHAAFDWLGDDHPLHRRLPPATRDLRAEGQQLVAIVHERRAVDRSQAGDRLNRARAGPPAIRADRRRLCCADELGELRERRARRHRASARRSTPHQSVDPAGTTSNMPPRPCARIDAAMQHEHVHRRVRLARAFEAEQQLQQRRAVRHARAALVHHLQLVALEHRDVDELADDSAPMLDDEQPRSRRPRSRRSAAEIARVVPQTLSSPVDVRHTPRWMPGRSTAGASFASPVAVSDSGRSKRSGCRVRSGGDDRERDLRASGPPRAGGSPRTRRR